MIRVVGVDGWKGKWVGVFLKDGKFTHVKIFENLAEISALQDPAVIAIDVPIGLTDAASREADAEARKKLGPRSSSVFNAPAAFALDPGWDNYSEANAESKRRYDAGISAQGFALMKNIREADAVARADERVFEVHPEVCFWEMNNREPLIFAKKTWNGQAKRIELLRAKKIEIPIPLSNPELGKVTPDDLLDAAGAAWSAHRIATGGAKAIPNADERLYRIWY